MGRLGKVWSVSKSITPMPAVVDPEFATQSFDPSTEMASPLGEEPIGIALVMVNEVVSMTMTVFSLGTVA